MQEQQKRITVSLSEECYEALRKYAYDANLSLSAAAKQLCQESLERHKYGTIESEYFVRTVK